jgi:hypothetical protein
MYLIAAAWTLSGGAKLELVFLKILNGIGEGNLAAVFLHQLSLLD